MGRINEIVSFVVGVPLVGIGVGRRVRVLCAGVYGDVGAGVAMGGGDSGMEVGGWDAVGGGYDGGGACR